MVRPVRIRLSRRRGSDLQAASRAANGFSVVVVARPSKWGSLFRIGDPAPAKAAFGGAAMTAEDCVRLFRRQWERVAERRRRLDLAPLSGKNLACWCPPDRPCHAHVLLELANG